MNITKKDVEKGLKLAFDEGLECALNNADAITEEVKHVLQANDDYKCKYVVTCNCNLYADLERGEVVVSAKVKFPRADMVETTEELEFLIDETDQPLLPYCDTTDEPEPPFGDNDEEELDENELGD